MSQSLAYLRCHVVFSTRNRTPTIVPGIRPRLYEYIAGTLRRRGSKLLEAGGTADHVHLLISLSKRASISSAVREAKSNSSRWVHKTFPDLSDFRWQGGYGAFAVSYSGLDNVKRYILRQQDHHRTLPYEEEFIALLDEHEIEYDEKHLWD